MACLRFCFAVFVASLASACSAPLLPDGHFACGEADCPPGMVCADDGLCYWTAQPDAASAEPDATPDIPDAHTDGPPEVSLSGNLSGRISHPGAVVVIASDIDVIAWNGADDVSECDEGETGCLRIEAGEIRVLAGVSIDASGAGYGGGGGGGGGPGNAGPGQACSSTCRTCSVGAGGNGALGGAAGNSGGTADAQSISGAGGRGGGPFGGAGSGAVTSTSPDGPRAGGNGQAGGYAAAAANGDSSTDTSLRMGSGGGGGAGGASAYEPFYSSVGGSGGGGAGNSGGGYVALVATDRLVIEGNLVTRGLSQSSGSGGPGTNGYLAVSQCDLEGSGGPGGNAGASGSSAGGAGVAGYFQSGWNSCIERQCEDNGSGAVSGGEGGDGGPGAGGGVLLEAPEIELGGGIDARGGAAATNGGTVKVFYQGTAPSQSTIQAGRVYLHEY